jgi:hypothetical protein
MRLFHILLPKFPVDFCSAGLPAGVEGECRIIRPGDAPGDKGGDPEVFRRDLSGIGVV